LRDMRDSTDVFSAILPLEPKIGCQALTNVVSVKHVACMAQRDQLRFEFECDGRFARARQAGQPDRDRLLAEDPHSLLTGDCAVTTLQQTVSRFHCESPRRSGAVPALPPDSCVVQALGRIGDCDLKTV